MISRTDFYGECNVVGAPVDAFTGECCVFCVNPECTRSSFGKSKFDIRVSTWYERLYSNVPRMNPEDPRFEKISAQRFIPINPPLSINSGWVDPRDLSPQDATSAAVAPPLILTPDPKPEPQLQLEPELPQKGHLSKDLTFANTPVQQGQMIAQGKKPVTSADPWSAPPPSTDTENVRVIKPGGKVRLG